MLPEPILVGSDPTVDEVNSGELVSFHVDVRVLKDAAAPGPSAVLYQVSRKEGYSYSGLLFCGIGHYRRLLTHAQNTTMCLSIQIFMWLDGDTEEPWMVTGDSPQVHDLSVSPTIVCT